MTRPVHVMLVAILAAAGLASRPGAQTARLAPLDAFVEAELARTGAPGAAVVVIDGDAVIHAKGHGVADVETGAAVTPESLFQIGSLTMPFTAAAVLHAVERGDLALDATASSLISGLVPCVGQATIAQLLSHTGGLIDEPAESGPAGEKGLASYPRTWTSDSCLLEPGRAFSASNSGYALAGLALQERDRMAFADVVRSRVLDPLGMPRTTFRPAEVQGPRAVGHRRQNGVATVAKPLANDARLWPAGTMYSSAQEMSRLLLALANNGRLGDRQVLPPGVIRAMTTPRTATPTVAGGQYGYGVFLDQYRGLRRLSHTGGMTGYGAALAVLPDRRIGVVVLANGDGAILAGVATRVLDLLLDSSPTPPPPATPAPARTFDLEPAWLDRYVGTYTHPRRVTIEIIRAGDDMLLRRMGRDVPMRPVGPDRFAVASPGGGEELVVAGLGPSGRADYVQMTVWAFTRVRERTPGLVPR